MKIYDIPCPECGAERKTSNRQYASLCRTTRKQCKACTLKDASVRCSGEGNPFYGKKHNANQKHANATKNRDYMQTEDYRNRQSIRSSGASNPMSGKSFHDVWIEHYGKEEADARLEEFKSKRSRLMTGENNHMFGTSGAYVNFHSWFMKLNRMVSNGNAVNRRNMLCLMS